MTTLRNARTNAWMFEQSFKRPSNFFELSQERQWDIDKELEILDWEGGLLTEAEKKRFNEHYDKAS